MSSKSTQMTHEEEEEVRSLLSRHRERIMSDLGGTDLLAVLVKNSVLTQSEEDLLLKTYPAPSSAPSSVGVTKRKLSAVASSGSAGSSSAGGSGSGGGTVIDGVYGSSIAGSSANNSRSASVNGDHAQSDNRSITPSVVSVGGGIVSAENSVGGGVGDYCTKDDLHANLNSINDADVLRLQCANLIEIIAKSGFEKFKQFCYAIESECPQLIEDLINDRLKCDSAIVHTSEDKIQKEIETIDYIDKEKENERNRRAVSYGGSTTPISTTLPRAAPRRVSLMKEPPPPPPPKPLLSQQSSIQSSATASPIPSKYPQSEYNLIQKLGSNSTLTAPAQYQAQNFYANTSTLSTNTNTTNGNGNGNSNYSSLLCHASSTSSPLAVRKREKLLHRFSDAATLGRKLKKKKNTNRTCRSMTEAIEMLADPVIEDEFFGDRTTWEYHTVSVTRVPGYGFGIAVSGGRDNPHFANGDPSIAVSDVLKGGPAEDRLQVNDRIISVNGVSLENVEYATAVQVLRDSGNTVTLVVKRRVPLNAVTQQHQHSHSMSSVGLSANGNGMPIQTPVGMSSMSQPNSLNSSMIQSGMPGQPIKVTLSKSSKKDDYGIVLGCRLFVKEISTKARDQLVANGYTLQEGDIVTRIHNTNCGDSMSLKEAKKIIDGCKERLNLVVLRDITNQTVMPSQLNNSTTQSNLYVSHQAQVSNCSNNLDDPYLGGGANYSSQNLYVQPPTRSSANGPANGLNDEKSNLTPRGRSRGPIMDGVSLSQLDRPVTPTNGTRMRADEPPRPPPPRGPNAGNNGTEDFYSSRRQLYEDDPLTRSRQSAEPRFISFQKEGSVGIRLTGGNEAGIFVTAVQPGSPASLQGLTPGDKILKVNDMDMHGVTREEAVLFLLSLQDRIDLIVQYCKEEYDEVVTNQRGDSFHIKTHFHCDNPSKGEMAFKAGDVFRVIDTLHNGVVGSWQVLKIGRGHQEMQRGVIPNKARAEELATAQFNATKKEMNANESRGNFFRRRRSTHRRSKSLSRENWDDVVFSDSISKFPAYERVVLRHPGFVRPLVLFGPISDLAREKLAKDFPDKFSTPLQDDDKSNGKCRIVRLSNIRDIMDRGKHALLDITPNAVDRLNYAQFYPVVIFLKTDSKHVIKQLRHGLPKSAHKSSKKLLEQCQKLERVWSHIFSTQIVLNDEESWYRKLREAIDLQQSGAVWMSESKLPDSPTEMIFPPYIAPPCNLPCCRPASISVPRCPSRRRNSFSLLPDDGRSLTPPRPPPLGNEQTYHSIPTTPATKPSQRLTSYTMVPIIKPSSSMPGGLATKHAYMTASHDISEPIHDDDGAAQYHSSQPNLVANYRSNGTAREATPQQDSLSISNITAAITNLTVNSASCSGKYELSKGAAAPRNGVRTPYTIERRTTPYYYHELLQKSTLFDSNLNLLHERSAETITASHANANGNGNGNGCVSAGVAGGSGGNAASANESPPIGATQHRTAATVAAAAAGASIQNGSMATQMPLPRRRLHNSGSKLAMPPSSTRHYAAAMSGGDVDGGAYGASHGYMGGGYAASSSNLLNNGNSSSAGTLVDECGFGPIPAARSLTSFNTAANSSNSNNKQLSTINQIKYSSSNGNNNNNNSNHSININSADTNNNVGSSNECIA